MFDLVVAIMAVSALLLALVALMEAHRKSPPALVQNYAQKTNDRQAELVRARTVRTKRKPLN